MLAGSAGGTTTTVVEFFAGAGVGAGAGTTTVVVVSFGRSHPENAKDDTQTKKSIRFIVNDSCADW